MLKIVLYAQEIMKASFIFFVVATKNAFEQNKQIYPKLQNKYKNALFIVTQEHNTYTVTQESFHQQKKKENQTRKTQTNKAKTKQKTYITKELSNAMFTHL